MDLETANYITRYYSKFYNEKELRASAHWSGEFKIAHSLDNSEEGRSRIRNLYLKNGRITRDPEILKLLSEGIDQFKINTASRIFKEHSREILLNKCRKCETLARTPVAKQCKSCGFDWHNELVGKVVSHLFYRSAQESFQMDCHISSGKIEQGDLIDFYHFGLFVKARIEQIEFKGSLEEIGIAIMTIKLSGVPSSSQDELLSMKYSKELEVLRIGN